MEPVTFDALLEPMVWGATYTVVRLDARVVAAAAAAGTHRLDGWVEGAVEQVPVNVGIARSGVLEDAYFYVGKPLLRRLGLRPGDLVTCRLRPVDPDVVPVPEDVAEALAGAGADDAFEARSPAERRRLLQPVEAAVQAATRARRIDALLGQLHPPRQL